MGINSAESVEYKRFGRVELAQALKKNKKDFGDAYLFILQTYYPEILTYARKRTYCVVGGVGTVGCSR